MQPSERAMVDQVRRLGLTGLKARVHAGNDASRYILTKLGFRLTGACPVEVCPGRMIDCEHLLLDLDRPIHFSALDGRAFAAIEPLMRRLWALLILCVGMSLFTASLAHAGEGLRGADTRTAIAMSHSDGDGDQVPADAEKAYPHHHGQGHDHHQMAEGLESGSAVFIPYSGGILVAPKTNALRATAIDPALRPPQA